MALTIRKRALITSVVFAAVVAVLAGLSLYAVYSLTLVLKKEEETSAALRAQMESDMAHDALRADVLRAMHVGKDAPEQEKREIQDDLEEHIKTFKENMDANAQRALPEAVHAQIGVIEKPLNDYIAGARENISATFAGAASAENYGSFQTLFSRLETEMGKLSDLMQAELSNVSKEANNDTHVQMILLALAGLVGLGISFFVAIITRGTIVLPLSRLTACTLQLAGGDNETAVFGAERKDEIGEMARAVNVFKENAQRMAAMEAEKKAAREKAAVEETKLRTEVSGVVESVSSAATELYACAESLSQIAGTTSERAHRSAQNMEEGAKNVEAIAAAGEQMAATIDQVCRQVTDTSSATADVVFKVKSTTETIEALATAAQKIDGVVQLIRDIAAQTNLLALNASIEAARAGDAGKGFAVVAQSVKALADQTADATKTITDEVKSIQDLTMISVESVEGINALISKVNNITQATAAAVEEQSVTTQQISTNLQQISSSITGSRNAINAVSESAGQSGTAASEVQSAARELSIKSEQMRALVEGFLARLAS